MVKMKILSICGSPRRGNSEAVLNKLNQIFEKMKVENEIILLRGKSIQRCMGCVEYCNKNLQCHKKDDMPEILEKIKNADGYVFISPNYFNMPSGLFKDFIDRCSVLYTKAYFSGKNELSSKKAAVIAVGTDEIPEIDKCVSNIADNFCRLLGVSVVARKSFRSRSELKGNYNDMFENGLNPNINEDLEKIANDLQRNLK